MRQTQRQRVKWQLNANGSITNVEAVNMKILRLSERIRELEEDGMVITKTREPHGVYRYTLTNRKPRIIGWDTSTGVARPIMDVPGV